MKGKTDREWLGDEEEKEGKKEQHREDWEPHTPKKGCQRVPE